MAGGGLEGRGNCGAILNEPADKQRPVGAVLAAKINLITRSNGISLCDGNNIYREMRVMRAA